MLDRVPAEEVIARLREVPFLAELPDELLDSVRRQGIVRRYNRGEAVFTRGEPARALFVVVRGGVRVFQSGAGGPEQVPAIEKPGSPVADLDLFDGGDYAANGEAAEDTVLFTLNRDRFDALVRAHPELARKAIQVLAARLRALVER